MPTKKLLGARIREAREGKGWTQEELGRRFGVSHAAVSDLERGITQKVDIDDLQRLADLLDRALNYFLGRETEEDRLESALRQLTRESESIRRELWKLERTRIEVSGALDAIPMRGSVPGGYLDLGEEQEPEGYLPLPKAVVMNPEKAYAVRVSGDSMERRAILDGDVLVVDMTLEPRPGDIVVVRRGDQAVLCIYNTDDKGGYLETANEGSQSLRVKEVQILGVVVYSGRNYRK